MPASTLEKILKNVGLSKNLTEDCAVKEIGNNKIIATNVDIFTPIYDDPKIMGEITACNSTNDLFAMNIVDILMYLSFLGVPNDQPLKVTEGLLEGQREFLKQFNIDIYGGHTIINPWPLIGGIAVGIGDKKDLIPKQIKPNIKNGGELLLTKPLGLQAAMATYRVLLDHPELLEDFEEKFLRKGIDLAIKIMRSSNYYVAKVIRDENLHNIIASMTDVTGFGLKVHASEMLQERKFDIIIDALPIIMGTDKLSTIFSYDLLGGCAAETAGPMLICIDTDKIDTAEVQRLLLKENIPSWKIGKFENGSGNVNILDNINVIQVDKY